MKCVFVFFTCVLSSIVLMPVELWFVGIIALVVSTLGMLMYLLTKEHTFVADIPNGSLYIPAIFLVITLLSPFNWLVYVTSIVRMRHYYPRWEEWDKQRRENRDRERTQQREEHAKDKEIRVQQEEARSKIAASDLPSYSGSPVVGEAAYIDALVRHGTCGTMRKREELRRREVDITDLLRKLQVELNETRAGAAKCDEVIAKFLENLNEEDVAREFKKLLDLPAVLAVRVVDDQMQLVIRCQAEVDGRLYDLGDWYLWIDTEYYFQVRTKLIRDGRRPGISGYNDPPHINPGGTFCFGRQEEKLSDLVMRGQAFAALTVAMNYMCQTLPNREHQIPVVFKRITT